MTHTAHSPERMLALGSSMFPCVPSGSVLALRRATVANVAPGDIVVFVAPNGLCAHRLLKLIESPSGKRLLVRGDAQKHCETIEEAALVFAVTHVAHRFIAYRTDSLFGRALSHCARRRGLSFRLGALLLSAAARLTPRRSAPVAPSSGVLSMSTAPRASLVPEGPIHARDSMLRGLKHELRTPLNAILGFADLLLGELDGPLDADERENVSVVRDAGQTLLALINEVLDLATALMVPSEPVYEVYDVMALLEEVRHEIEQRCGMRPVHVRVDGTLSQLEARVDPRTLARVLRALGDIALSATTAGGITLGATLTHEQLSLWIAADGFDAHGLRDARDPVELALGGKRQHDRSRRSGAMRVAIAGRLLASQGGCLSVQRMQELPALCIHLPLRAADSQAHADLAQGADMSLALSYIASMGHDLRTPLNAILGFADLLTMSKRHAWSTAQLRSLEIVRERAVDLTALIDDMIDWAKLEAGELELQRELTAVLPMVERALAAATERSGTRGLSLSLHTETPDAGKVWADASRCVQALLGLLENAIRGNPGREVQVRLQRTAASVRIEIEDPGLEIRAEDHTGVFDAFRPSYAPTGQRIAGLQLGPSVARSLLRAHGGDVWFESRPGRGTTFTATLPVAAGAGLA